MDTRQARWNEKLSQVYESAVQIQQDYDEKKITRDEMEALIAVNKQRCISCKLGLAALDMADGVPVDFDDLEDQISEE